MPFHSASGPSRVTTFANAARMPTLPVPEADPPGVGVVVVAAPAIAPSDGVVGWSTCMRTFTTSSGFVHAVAHETDAPEVTIGSP